MTRDRRTIYPVRGRTVRAPELSYQPIPAEGLEVEWTPHWQQMLNFGDIRLKVEPADADAKETAAPKKS